MLDDKFSKARDRHEVQLAIDNSIELYAQYIAKRRVVNGSESKIK